MFARELSLITNPAGYKFVEPLNFDLGRILADNGPRVPMVFLLHESRNPMKILKRLKAERDSQVFLVNISQIANCPASNTLRAEFDQFLSITLSNKHILFNRILVLIHLYLFLFREREAALRYCASQALLSRWDTGWQ